MLAAAARVHGMIGLGTMRNSETKTMWIDPVVQEVRDAADKLAREAGYDLHRFCERVQEHERRYADRLVRLGPRRLGPTPRGQARAATES